MAARQAEADRRREASGNGEGNGAVVQLRPSAAPAAASTESRELARKRLVAQLERLERAMDKVIESEPMQIVTLSKRHSEVLAELLALDAPGPSTPGPAGEVDPFEGLFGAGGTARRAAATPRT
ncbi:hypothetical protein [Microcella frigidaquae]|uniref:hypothetical protein n=1 Tax=Microcella frigidaquae TaxID=424758 RepID=UPI0014046982|nr:hypothetical protein [Microcella frigidaquae]NHN45088.1 hypothetical protein [Microcella frigidaquae]